MIDDRATMILLALAAFTGGLAVGHYVADLDRPAIVDVNAECLP